MKVMKYQDKTLKDMGHRALWGRTQSGTRILMVSISRGPWFYLDLGLWWEMQKEGVETVYRSKLDAKQLVLVAS